MKKWMVIACGLQAAILLVWMLSQSHYLIRASADRRYVNAIRALKGGHGRPVLVTSTSRQRMNVAAAEERGVTQHSETESIFIALASYGDSECSPTVARAFERAAFPDRVFFGIFQQHNCSGLDDDLCRDCVASIHDQLDCPSHPLCSRLWQIRVSRLPMGETQGITFGRHMAEKHYRNETYVLSIDSHTHFVRGWDSDVIDIWKSIGDDNAIITTYPASYTESQMGHAHSDTFEMPDTYSELCICSTNRVAVSTSYNFKHVASGMRRPDRPVRTAFLAAGFNFAKGHRIARVPYDPYTPFLFDGEEMSFAIRAWTKGYDFYHPHRKVVAHLYISSGSAHRPVFWTQNWSVRYKIQHRSVLRINYILGLHDVFDQKVPVETIDLREIDTYGVGSARTVQQYWDWAGINVSKSAPAASRYLCRVYESGGMPRVPRIGIDDVGNNDVR